MEYFNINKTVRKTGKEKMGIEEELENFHKNFKM